MIDSAVYTDIGGRPENEDTVRLVRRGNALCAVLADGLGGHGGGRRASSLAADTVCGGWDGSVEPQALEALLQQAHRNIQAIQTPLCKMKTTAVVLAVEDGRCAWANAGDSRLYRFRAGRLEYQTRDHSASQIAVLLGQITPDQIRFHEDRNRVYRALGQEDDISIDTGELSLSAPPYAWLLCSDGFWEYVLEKEMEEDLRSASTPAQWLERMTARLKARVREGNDNNTAAAVWLK